jgi:hypothetical protein
MKYRNKNNNAIVEAKQWTGFDDSWVNFLESESADADITLFDCTNWDDKFKCEDCGHNISSHGVLNAINCGLKTYTLICPGDYIVIGDRDYFCIKQADFYENYKQLPDRRLIVSRGLCIHLSDITSVSLVSSCTETTETRIEVKMISHKIARFHIDDYNIAVGIFDNLRYWFSTKEDECDFSMPNVKMTWNNGHETDYIVKTRIRNETIQK